MRLLYCGIDCWKETVFLFIKSSCNSPWDPCWDALTMRWKARSCCCPAAQRPCNLGGCVPEKLPPQLSSQSEIISLGEADSYIPLLGQHLTSINHARSTKRMMQTVVSTTGSTLKLITLLGWSTSHHDAVSKPLKTGSYRHHKVEFWEPTACGIPVLSCNFRCAITTTFVAYIANTCMLRQIFVRNAPWESTHPKLLAPINVFVGFVQKKRLRYGTSTSNWEHEFRSKQLDGFCWTKWNTSVISVQQKDL